MLKRKLKEKKTFQLVEVTLRLCGVGASSTRRPWPICTNHMLSICKGL